MPTQTCVGTYLTTRLKQLGVNHLFSVPGDYTSDFLEIVDNLSQFKRLEPPNEPNVDKSSPIKRIGNCNELNAGYAADGYARANGLGAVAVTTGVGAFSLLNAIGGSYVENIPVVAIIGTLSNTKLLDEINAGELYHHTVNSEDTNRTAYSPVTVAFERISNPMTAPAQIDGALTACISQSRPVAIEIMEDCYYMPCPAPVGNLTPIPQYEPLPVLKGIASSNSYAAEIVKAVEDASNAIYDMLSNSNHPVLWTGKEIGTYHLESKFLEFQDLVKAPIISSLLGKAVIPEDHPWYIGMHDGVFTSSHTKEFIGNCDSLIGLGLWNTDLNTFGAKTITPGNISRVFASRNMVKVGDELFVQVALDHLLDSLIDLVKTKGYKPVWQQPAAALKPPAPPSSAPITYDHFFYLLNNYISKDNLLVADIGLSTFGGSSSVTITRQKGFLAQTIWASIGWSVPAGLGASFTDQTRALVVVGDGAFKLTCQAISTMVAEGCNTVVFVLNNKVYGVEQMLLNPAPYKQGSTAKFEQANVLQDWDYVSLMNAFSNNASNAQSANVNTVQDLHNVLETVDQNPNSAFLVNINLNERDYPSAWQQFVNK